MKSINMLAAMAGIIALTAGTAASAASVTVEGAGNVGSTGRSVTPGSINVTAWDKFGPVSLGTEVEAIKYTDRVPTNVNVSLKLGTELTKVPFIAFPKGVSLYGVGELGQNFSGNTNTNFYGVEVGSRYRVFKPVVLNVSYRLRDGFYSDRFGRDQRVGAGATVDVSKNYSVGLNYYREFDRNKGNEIALNLTRRF